MDKAEENQAFTQDIFSGIFSAIDICSLVPLVGWIVAFYFNIPWRIGLLSQIVTGFRSETILKWLPV